MGGRDLIYLEAERGGKRVEESVESVTEGRGVPDEMLPSNYRISKVKRRCILNPGIIQLLFTYKKLFGGLAAGTDHGSLALQA